MAECSDELPPNPKVSYLTADHLGSPRIITDDDRDVVSRHDYLAFGDEVTETVGNVEGYTFSVSSENATEFQQIIKGGNFLSGSFYKAHVYQVRCKDKNSSCRDYRSKKNRFGINGSIQILYDKASGRG